MIMDNQFAAEQADDLGEDLRALGQVPLAALHAERGRRQAAERERDKLLAQMGGASRDGAVGDGATDEEPVEGDDADDQALSPWMGENQPGDGDFAPQLETLNERLKASEVMARSSFGDAAVDAAEAWAQREMSRDPALAAEVLAHPNPYAFALGFALSARGDRPAATAQPSADAMPAIAPPRSLAGAPSAGGAAHVPSGPGQAYDAIFRA